MKRTADISKPASSSWIDDRRTLAEVAPAGPWTTDMFIEEIYREVTPKPPVTAKPAAPVTSNKPAPKASTSAK